MSTIFQTGPNNLLQDDCSFPNNADNTAFLHCAPVVISSGILSYTSVTRGQTGVLKDEFECRRPLCYRDADVFLLCYSMVLPSSFRSVTACWAPEVHRLCPGVPIILVGTQCDLREDVQVLIRLANGQEKPVSGEDARLCTRSIGAVTFAECSALTQMNLKEVFDGAILASMRHAEKATWPRMYTLREKTPDKIKQLSETWWRKLSCVQSFDLQ